MQHEIARNILLVNEINTLLNYVTEKVENLVNLHNQR
jgi:hypothetical protein